MTTYYVTTIGQIDTQSNTWGAAKKLAAAAIKAGEFPIEIVQRTFIDGRSPHKRQCILIEDSEACLELDKGREPWQCIDSFYSHIHPSRSL